MFLKLRPTRLREERHVRERGFTCRTFAQRADHMALKHLQLLYTGTKINTLSLVHVEMGSAGLHLRDVHVTQSDVVELLSDAGVGIVRELERRNGRFGKDQEER